MSKDFSLKKIVRGLEQQGEVPVSPAPAVPRFEGPVTNGEMTLEQRMAVDISQQIQDGGQQQWVGPDRYDPVLHHHLNTTPPKRRKTFEETMEGYKSPNMKVIS